VLAHVAAQADEEVAVRHEARRHEQRRARDAPTAVDLDTTQVVVLDAESRHGALDDADRAGHQLPALGSGQAVGGREQDDVVGPLAEQLSEAGTGRRPPQHADLLIADLVAVAVRAVQHVARPPIS